MSEASAASEIEPSTRGPSVESVSTSPAKKPFRREIELDFIRGAAILMVVDYHSPVHPLFWMFKRMGWPVHFGWAGVDIFFVLSGFLVGGLLAKEWKLKGRIDVKHFLIRRGFKIWPQYYVFLLLNVITRHRTFASLWGNFLNIQNYVGGIAHTWTLAVEEHAYLLLAILLGAAAAWQVRVKVAFAGIAALTCAVVAWAFYYSHIGEGFERTDTRVDGILLGLLLAMLYHFAPDRFFRLQRMRLLLCGLILAALAYFRFPAIGRYWDQPLQWLLADLSGVGVFLLLYRRQPDLRRSWLYRAIAWIGLYSYGIYLWHLSVFRTVEALAARLPLALANPCVAILAPIAAICAGVIATRLVEFPTLAIRDRLFPRRVDSAAGVPAELEAGNATNP